MSVNYSFDANVRQGNSQQELLRNIMTRLDYLQNKQIKSVVGNGLMQQKGSSNELQKVKQNMKAIMNSNIDNLRMLEQNTKQNWEELVAKLNSLESKFIRIIKEKEQALTFLEYRVMSIQSSQKNVTQFMGRLAEQEMEKYSGVNLLEEKLKQLQHIYTLKQEKEQDSRKIFEMIIKQDVDKKIKQINDKVADFSKMIGRGNEAKQSAEDRLDEMQNKTKTFQIEMRENKRKMLANEQSIKLNSAQIKQCETQLKQILGQLKDLKKVPVNQKQKNTNLNQSKEIKQYNGFKTETNLERVQRNEVPSHNSAKKTLPTELKPPPPSVPSRNSRMQSRQESQDQNQYDLKIQRNKDKSIKRTNVKEDNESDPFQNMGGAGIRGLLRKSKQKQQKNHTVSRHEPPSMLDRKKPLPRQQKLGPLSQQPSPRGLLPGKNLPPVKADMKAQSKAQQRNESEQQQEQVYQVDQDGYLIDEDGNYLYNEDGERVQLSQQQMYSLMQQN